MSAAVQLRCFSSKYQLVDPALAQLAVIVRGADTAQLDLAPQAAGLLASHSGCRTIFRMTTKMLDHGMVIYDALYAWCRTCQSEATAGPEDTVER